MAITPFVSDIEMNKNIIYNPCFHIDSEDIASPKDGQYYLNSTDNKVYFYRTSDHQWHKLGDNSIIYSAGRGINIDNENVISVQDSIFDDINKNKDDIQAIDGEIDTINQVLTIMDGKIIQDRTRITSLEECCATVNSKITSLESNVSDLYSQLSGLGDRVSANTIAITNNAREMSDIKTRVSDDESQITTNKNNITSLTSRVTTNETDIANLKQTTRNTDAEIVALKNNKLDKNFTENLVTSVTLEKTDASVKLKEMKINPSTLATSTNMSEIPLVSSTRVGLATTEMVSSIADSQRRIEALEQLGGHYIGRSFATAAELKAYVIPDSVKVGDFTYVLDDEDHQDATTRYVVSINSQTENKEFTFAYIINYDPVGKFTQDQLGLIQGKNQEGYVYAESDGTGSVVGWDDLKRRISNDEIDIQQVTSDLQDLKDSDITTMKTDIVNLKSDVSDNTQDISSLQTNKVDKNKLQSVVTGLTLKSTADSSGNKNIVNLEESLYNSLTDRSSTSNIQIPLVTTGAAGLMSAEDKLKLNNMNEGAEVNQNAYSTIRVGANSLSASNKTDSFELKAGDGIALNVTPGTKTIEFQNTFRPIDRLATWLDKGLQSPYDKEREDKMGEEVWDATLNVATGNYTIDVGEYDGYIGDGSHIYVRFGGDNVDENPQLEVISSTESYTLIDMAPIMKFGDILPERGFILSQSIWELIYNDTTKKFYMVAASGESINNSGYSNVAPATGLSRILAKGTIGSNFEVFHIFNVVGIGSTSSKSFDSSGMLEIKLKSGANGLTDASLKWLSKSTSYKSYTEDEVIKNSDEGILANDNFKIYRNGSEWRLVFKNTDSSIQENSIFLQYKLLNSTDNQGNESKIDILINESDNPTGTSSVSKFEVMTSPDNSHQVKGIIQLTQAEFATLISENGIIEGMLYDIIDDQADTKMVTRITNYNTFNPTMWGLNSGDIVEIRADDADGFATNTRSSSGMMIAGIDTYTIICQEEGKDDSLYYRTYKDGAWGSWHKIASSKDLELYVTSTDRSVKDIKTLTQSEYDDLLIAGTTDPSTMYNVTNSDGFAMVSRIAEYTDLLQLGVSPVTNLDPAIIFDVMPDNSILYTQLIPNKFTLKNCTKTDATVEFVKLDSSHFYVRVIDKKTTDNPYIYE